MQGRRSSEQMSGTKSPGLVVVSQPMIQLLRAAERAAISDAKVLITGESGVGKDLVARQVHRCSGRSGAAYIAVNCAGIAESLLESELFGHVKGSFTGAYRDAPGKLQVAHGGTLFLDEVGEMSLRMQALLLRFLENGEIHTVGADTRRIVVDVRVVAATNKNLADLVRAGQFREDLLYRLDVIHLQVPPLRQRRADIRPLVLHFLKRSGTEVSLTENAWKALEQYRWPGNVRQLQNIVEQIRCLSSGEGRIDVHDLPAFHAPRHHAARSPGTRAPRIEHQPWELSWSPATVRHAAGRLQALHESALHPRVPPGVSGVSPRQPGYSRGPARADAPAAARREAANR
jgi:transcriptional regulator with PAS, ATPase and Fis domain